MSEETLSQGMRDACRIMGQSLYSTDRFVRSALEWLGTAGHVWCEFHEDSWSVYGEDWFAGDETLPWALVAAVRTVEAREEVLGGKP
ncbi:MAG TPA: hypothetical protein VM487_18430 [Phycisphaerae bacterium]|nr:hypothetical protein [Phycisphaerae bacterium]